MALPTTQQQIDIAGIYAAFWDRAPDPAGFGYWVDLYANGLDLDTIADAFRDAPEGQQAYPLYLTAEEFVAQVYTNVFDRAPDAAGLAYWTNLLENDGYTEGEVVTLMTNAAQALENEDGALYDNKIEVALWVATDYLSGNATQDQIDVVTSNAFRYVTADPASIATAELYISRLPVGTPYDLTVTQDIFNGVAGNDLFEAQLGAANANTLTLGDRLNGGEGWDTLDVTLSASVAANVFQVSTIEEVNISAAGTDVGITNAFAGVELVQFEDTSAYDVFVGGLTGQVDVELYNVTNANLTVESGVTAAAQTIYLDTVDTATVTLNDTTGGTGVQQLNVVSFGGGAQDITIAGDVANAVELDITATAGISFAAITMNELTDLNIIASGDVNLSHSGVDLASSANGTITVDATLTTGDVSLDLNNAGGVALYADFGAGDDTLDIQANVAAGASIVDVVMGSGADTVEVNFTLPGNTNVSLDGGVGVDDTLVIFGAATAVDIGSVDLAKFGTVTGFETLDFSGNLTFTAAATVTLSSDIDTVVFDSISFGTDAGLSLVNGADDLTVAFGTVAAIATTTEAYFDFNVDSAGDVVISMDYDFNDVAGASDANEWNFNNATSVTFDISDTGSAAGVTLDFTAGDRAGTAVYAVLDASVATDFVFTGGNTVTFLDFDISGLSTTSDLSSLDTIDLSGFAGTMELNLAVAGPAGAVIENDLTVVLGTGVDGHTFATITGTTDVANIYELSATFEGDVTLLTFDNLHGAGNSDLIDLSALNITNFNQIDVNLVSGNTYTITAHSGQFDGSITATCVNAGGLTAGDFIFA